MSLPKVLDYEDVGASPSDTTRVEDEMEPYFKGMFISQKFGVSFLERAWMPPTDVFETDKHMVVRIEIPGVRLEDVSITADPKKIVVRGKRIDEAHASRRSFKQMEINFGNFERIIPLSRPVDVDETDAQYENGFLIVRIPFARKMRGVTINIPIKFE